MIEIFKLSAVCLQNVDDSSLYCNTKRSRFSWKMVHFFLQHHYSQNPFYENSFFLFLKVITFLNNWKVNINETLIFEIVNFCTAKFFFDLTEWWHFPSCLQLWQTNSWLWGAKLLIGNDVKTFESARSNYFVFRRP